MMQVLCLGTFAQTINGRVVDESTTLPLDNVSVSMLTEKGRPVAFSHTDGKGLFSITNPTDKRGDRLLFSILGYSKDTIMISDFTNGQDIRLHSEAFRLNEIKVKAERINRSGDTLTYNVSAFKQKQDRTISDVIAKMPGLTVTSSGEIKYQGRTINKFYIEGLDLLGSKYALASENLKADLVQSVQVMEGHQPVRVLKNVVFSDQAALNIVLKEEAKDIWEGQLEAGVGATIDSDKDFLRDTKLLAMFFSKKKQSISMYKTNNNGKDIERELIDQVKERNELRSEESLIEDVTINHPQISSKRYRFNDAHVIATNWLFKTLKNDEFRFQLNGVLDNSDFSGSSQTTIIDAENGESYIDKNETLQTKRNELSAELTYSSNRDNKFFSNIAKGYINFSKSDGMSHLNNIALSQLAKKDKRFFSDKMELISTLSENNTFSLQSRFIYDYLPSSLLLIDGSTEQLSQQRLEWDASTSFRHKLFGLYVTYNAGVSYRMQKLYVRNMFDENNTEYNKSRIFLGPVLSYSNTSIKANARINLSLLNRRFEGQTKVNMIIEPNLFVDYKLTSKWSTSIIYSHIFAPSNFTEYIDQPIFTNYYTLRSGKKNLHNTTVDIVSNMWRYNDTIHGLFGNLNFSYSYTDNNILFERKFVNGLYTNVATEYTSHNAQTVISGKIGKSIGWGKLSLCIDASLLNNQYQLFVDKQIVDFTMNRKSAGFSISYHPFDMLSLECSSTFNVNDRKSKEIDTYDTRQTFFYHNIKLYLLPGCWQIELSNDIFQSHDNSVSNSCFTDLSISYRRKTWEGMLMFNNIFGINNIEHISTSTNQITYTKSTLRPTEVLLKFSFAL